MSERTGGNTRKPSAGNFSKTKAEVGFTKASSTAVNTFDQAYKDNAPGSVIDDWHSSFIPRKVGATALCTEKQSCLELRMAVVVELLLTQPKCKHQF
jgi:hypothetical protein